MNINPERVSFNDDLTIRFEGENAIDVQQLFGYIAGIQAAYKASLDTEYHSPEMELKIVAINKGSFEIALQSVVLLAPNLIKALPTVITTFKALMEMIKLKRELRGNKPKSIEEQGGKVKVVNTEGDVSYYNCSVVNNYFNNPQIDAGITRAFASIDRGIHSRDAVCLSSAQETLRIEKDDFPECSTEIVSLPMEENRKEVSTFNTRLKIGKMDFIGDTMWSLIDLDGKKVQARIEDERFLANVRSGKIQISANLVMKVRIRVEAEFDVYLELKKKNNFIEEVYQTEVVQQTEMDFDGLQ